MDVPALRRTTTVVVLLAFAVSVAHYLDNYRAYEEYPRSDTLPHPSAELIGLAWFFFTAFAISGLLFLRRRRDRAAAISFAVFSGSGLVGIGHYLVEGTSSFPWWRHAHVIGDIALGLAVLACAFALSRVRSTP